jgi:hypothetical protein
MRLEGSGSSFGGSQFEDFKILNDCFDSEKMKSKNHFGLGNLMSVT